MKNFKANKVKKIVREGKEAKMLFDDIEKLLNVEGYTTPTGKPWSKASVTYWNREWWGPVWQKATAKKHKVPVRKRRKAPKVREQKQSEREAKPPVAKGKAKAIGALAELFRTCDLDTDSFVKCVTVIGGDDE